MPKELRAILFGATGMVGSGVLKACLDDPDVSAVLAILRSPSGVSHPKLRELIHKDFYDYSAIQGQLAGYNACLFALGVTSLGLDEAQYSRLTYDLTVAAAEAVLAANPGMSFCYVSGQGTDSTEKGSAMWARVKGRLENRLLAMPFRPAVMFRPGGIIPMKGIRSKTWWYQAFYALLTPLLRVLMPVFPKFITSSERLGRAMLRAARGEAGAPILEPIDINRLGA